MTQEFNLKPHACCENGNFNEPHLCCKNKENSTQPDWKEELREHISYGPDCRLNHIHGDIERFIESLLQAERERCAEIADDVVCNAHVELDEYTGMELRAQLQLQILHQPKQ